MTNTIATGSNSSVNPIKHFTGRNSSMTEEDHRPAYYNTMLAITKRNDLKNRLKFLSEIDINEVDPDSLPELAKIRIDTSLPPEERVNSLFRQVENPYFYKCGDIVVKIGFANKGKTLQSCMEEYLKSEIRMKGNIRLGTI